MGDLQKVDRKAAYKRWLRVKINTNVVIGEVLAPYI